MAKIEIDLEEFAEQVKRGQSVTAKGGVLNGLLKELTEMTLRAEIDSHLAQDLEKNRKNGYSKKRMRTEHGEFELETPRDRNGSFEPQIVKKHQTSMSDEIEKKMLSLFSLGSSQSQIIDHIDEIYGTSFSKPAVTAVTDKLLPMLEEWKRRPLDPLYPFIYLDAIHFKVREDGRYVNKAFYTVLGVSIEGKKEILGLYLGESEGSRFWLQVLTDLQNRGLEDILIASIDGLKGFPEAIESIFPQTQIQLCIVHQIRNSLKYVASKDQKVFAKDLKKIYQASSKEEAEFHLEKLQSQWGKKYPIVVDSWHNKWEHLSNYFHYPKDIRRIIYTTNIIESVHRQFRTLTKTKGAFPNENSLLKLLYAGIQNAQKKWTRPIQNWSLTISQLNIHFKERLEKVLRF